MTTFNHLENIRNESAQALFPALSAIGVQPRNHVVKAFASQETLCILSPLYISIQLGSLYRTVAFIPRLKYGGFQLLDSGEVINYELS
jgi:hypothetical protein